MNPSFDELGMTLAEFARHRGISIEAARQPYGKLMRLGQDPTIAEPVRVRRSGDLVKFCMPIARSDRVFETESVVIPMRGHRGENWRTLCVSSQIGCKMGCTFCETGKMGLLENLSTAEIVAQRIAARRFATSGSFSKSWSYEADGIRNIVFMGMGEPFDNFEPVAQAIRVFSDPAGFNIPHSQITISTVGRIDGLQRLAALNWPHLRIAVSLNAADDALRDELMPVNRNTPLRELRQALLSYPIAKKSYFMIEYVVIKNVNDALQHADLVADWCRPLRCAVNLIPYNPQSDGVYETPSDETVYAFLRRLRERGQFVKWRRTQGRDLMGACGQLGNPASRKQPHRLNVCVSSH